MTQETQLLRELSVRVPYGVKCSVKRKDGTEHVMTLKTSTPNVSGNWEFYSETCSVCSSKFKMYLRSMSSMTKEERYELQEILGEDVEINDDFIRIVDSSRKIFSFLELQAVFNWLIAHHFDYLGLIPKGLAIEAPEGMYNFNEETK